jgi:hypothetical protein
MTDDRTEDERLAITADEYVARKEAEWEADRKAHAEQVRATDDYLLKLKALLYSWIADIDQEMALRIDAHNRMTEEP